MSRPRFPRILIAAAVLGGTFACNDHAPAAPRDDKVTAVTVDPSNLVMSSGAKVSLSATVAAGPDQGNRRVRWASRNPSVATVDEGGLVSALAGGNTTITATSLADTTVAGAAAVTVVSFGPTVTVAAINHNGAAADLGNASGTLDVIVNVDGSSPLISRADLVLNSAGADTVVASFQPSAATPGPVTLSFNSAGLHNGQWTLRVRVSLTSGASTVSSTSLITIHNP